MDVILASDEYKSVASQLLTVQQIAVKTDGRDKLLKVLQYTAKVWLLAQQGKPTDFMKRMEHMVSAFSTTRKVIRLGHAVEPFGTWHELMNATSKNPFHALSLLNSGLSVLNDISDDLVCLSKLQVLDKSWKHRFEPISARLWFTCISIDLYTTYVEYLAVDEQWRRSNALQDGPDEKLEHKRFWLQVTLMKLLADAIFCSVDLNNAWWSQPDQAQAWSGWISGLLSFYKLYSKHFVKVM